jgi:hypothetical protein
VFDFTQLLLGLKRLSKTQQEFDRAGERRARGEEGREER